MLRCYALIAEAHNFIVINYFGTASPPIDSHCTEPCLNGGECLVNHVTRVARCQCLNGYYGDRCQETTGDDDDDDDVSQKSSTGAPGGVDTSGRTSSSDPCSPNPCLNGGRCLVNREDAAAVCACPQQWTGKHCQVVNTTILAVKLRHPITKYLML